MPQLAPIRTPKVLALELCQHSIATERSALDMLMLRNSAALLQVAGAERR